MKTTIKKTNILIFIFRSISIAIILISIYFILNWYLENKKNKNLLDNISSSVISVETNANSVNLNNINATNNTYSDNINNNDITYNIDFNKLLNQCPNAIAWIKVNNTSINYPVVKYNNNDFYLTHSFDNSYNSAGSIFADYRNTFDGADKNIIVYGHNRRDGSMFATLKNILNRGWYSNTNNYVITLSTPSQNISYKVFSIYSIKAETYYTTTSFKDSNEYNNFLSTIKNRSIYDFNEILNTSDTILTLSTCANDNSYRVVLHAKKIDV